MIKYIFILLPLSGYSQDQIQKKANAIEITGVSFKEVAMGLLDAGYIFEHVDSNFQIIKTEFKEGSDKRNKSLNLRLFIRVKDSTVTINGEYYNRAFLGMTIAKVEQTVQNSTHRIEYTSGSSKSCFLEMNTFAGSFKKPISYLAR